MWYTVAIPYRNGIQDVIIDIESQASVFLDGESSDEIHSDVECLGIPYSIILSILSLSGSLHVELALYRSECTELESLGVNATRCSLLKYVPNGLSAYRCAESSSPRTVAEGGTIATKLVKILSS